MLLRSWHDSFNDDQVIKEHKPWVTVLILATCIALWVGLIYNDNYKTWEGLARWGYPPPDKVWGGAWWALISATLIHIQPWHLFGNVFGLWVLGHRIEHALGSRRFLLFYLSAAFVSSSFQLFFGDGMGHGASGALYAVFGFMLATRHRYAHFKRALDAQNIALLLIWLFVCIWTTQAGILRVGNAAHFSGFIFGVLVAGCFVLDFKRRLWRPVLGLMGALSFVPLFWCPWSEAWLMAKAYRAYTAGDYHRAIDYFDRIIRLDPDNAWAYESRGGAEYYLGEYPKYLLDVGKARELKTQQETAAKTRKP